jgi:hypothetical protein
VGRASLIFRAGDKIFIESPNENRGNRYFPGLLEPYAPAGRAPDGEIVIAKNGALDLDPLRSGSIRQHPE